MFNIINASCPYNNWVTTARESCADPDRYHCLTDEYSRPGWICTDPIWVEASKWQTYWKSYFFFIKFKINMIYTCININSAETTKTISTIDLVNMLLVIIFGNFLCSLKFIFFYKIIHKNAQNNSRQMPGI